MLRHRLAFLCAASQRLSWLAPLLARASVGLVFASAGWGKLQHLPRTVEFFRSLGIPAPALQAPFVATIELGCGALLVAGLATRLAALPLAFTMLVAIRTALWPELEGAIDLAGREEWLLFALLVWLASAGAGAASLDTLRVRWVRRAGASSGAAPVLAPRRRAVRS